MTGCVIKHIEDLNSLPSLKGMSQELIPCMLLTGDLSLDFNKVNALNFGDYA